MCWPLILIDNYQKNKLFDTFQFLATPSRAYTTFLSHKCTRSLSIFDQLKSVLIKCPVCTNHRLHFDFRASFSRLSVSIQYFLPYTVPTAFFILQKKISHMQLIIQYILVCTAWCLCSRQHLRMLSNSGQSENEYM